MEDTHSGNGGARNRILEEAWKLLVDRGAGSASMAQIAKAAGVSRQAVYLHFGSRAGLLVAMVRHHDENNPFVARLRAARERSPADARLLDDYFEAWLDYVPEIFPVARVLSSAAVTDPEAALAWNDRMNFLHARIGAVMRRLCDAGLLKREWTVETATDWAWSQTHVDVWRHLVIDRGWSHKRAKSQIIDTLRATLLHETPPRAQARRPDRGK